MKLIIEAIVTVCLVLTGFSKEIENSKNKSKPFEATAYSLKGRTASGQYVRRGIVAADPKILPLGTKVHIDTGHPATTGQYLVADTGKLIKKNRLDLWMPTSKEALKFGRRTVKLTILEYGKKKNTENKKEKDSLR